MIDIYINHSIQLHSVKHENLLCMRALKKSKNQITKNGY